MRFIWQFFLKGTFNFMRKIVIEGIVVKVDSHIIYNVIVWYNKEVNVYHILNEYIDSDRFSLGLLKYLYQETSLTTSL